MFKNRSLPKKREEIYTVDHELYRVGNPSTLYISQTLIEAIAFQKMNNIKNGMFFITHEKSGDKVLKEATIISKSYRINDVIVLSREIECNSRFKRSNKDSETYFDEFIERLG